MIKNAIVFRLTAPFNVEQLNDQLARLRFTPPVGFTPSSAGFEPYEADLDLAHQEGDVIVMRVRIDKKQVPSSAVKEAVKEKAVIIEKNQGYTPGRAQLREIKEQVTDELVSKALIATSRVAIYAYPDRLVIESSSDTQASDILSLFSKALTVFPIAPYHTAQSPSVCMTQWLTKDWTPDGFTVDDEAEMIAEGGTDGRVKWSREPIDTVEAAEHAAKGKACVKLALTWKDKISFVLTKNMMIQRIKFLDLVTEEASIGEDASLAADVALYMAELDELINELIDALGGLKAEG